MNYKVKIKYFADKVYTNTDIQTILNEIIIFTDISNVISITKIAQQKTLQYTYKLKLYNK